MGCDCGETYMKFTSPAVFKNTAAVRRSSQSCAAIAILSRTFSSSQTQFPLNNNLPQTPLQQQPPFHFLCLTTLGTSREVSSHRACPFVPALSPLARCLQSPSVWSLCHNVLTDRYSTAGAEPIVLFHHPLMDAYLLPAFWLL